MEKKHYLTSGNPHVAKYKGRCTSVIIFSSTHTLLLFILVFLSPAFLISCSAESIVPDNGNPSAPSTEISVTLSGEYAVPDGEDRAVDIFVFNDDRLQRLDSYQRTVLKDEKVHFAASQKGRKIILAVMNPQTDSYDWSHINSFQSFKNEKADLKKERPSGLLMSGFCAAEAGGDCTIELKPLAAEVRLRSIRCDFTGKPYSGSALENAKVYLTNVGTSARIMQDGGFSPEIICNQGGLREDDIAEFADPGIVVRDIGVPVGSRPVSPGISLMCYPNESHDETAGSPFTRLVIEGKIDGQTCYYPVNINKSHDGGKGYGITRNSCYIFDITVKSTGSSDPDTAVTPSDVDISCSIVPWNEKDDTEIIF